VQFHRESGRRVVVGEVEMVPLEVALREGPRGGSESGLPEDRFCPGKVGFEDQEIEVGKGPEKGPGIDGQAQGQSPENDQPHPGRREAGGKIGGQGEGGTDLRHLAEVVGLETLPDIFRQFGEQTGPVEAVKDRTEQPVGPGQPADLSPFDPRQRRQFLPPDLPGQLDYQAFFRSHSPIILP